MSRPQEFVATEVDGIRRNGVTVVIPSYEEWPVVERTLLCVEADARRLDRPCQIAVVDNGSSAWMRRRLFQLAQRSDADLELILREDLNGVHFRPGTARNIGVQRARYDHIVFLDADCIPAIDTLRLYCAALDASPDTVFLGHRKFVDALSLEPARIAHGRWLLDGLSPVRSASNYEEPYDRRLEDLRCLDRHERPYDCLHACNFAMSKRHFRLGVSFDEQYDGAWGYEDIDFGYQLYDRGSNFRYLAEAFVYHQEAITPPDQQQRNRDRLRNIQILDRKVGGFIEYRGGSTRICPLPRGIGLGGKSLSAAIAVSGSAPATPSTALSPASR